MIPALAAEGLERRVRLPNGELLELFADLKVQVIGGESVSIVGRSGSGKTSLLSILGLLSRPDSGTVTIAGNRADHLSDRGLATLRATSIGFVFQGYSLVPHMTARQNVELPLLQGQRLSRARRRTLVDHALRSAHIDHRADSLPRQMSGGEQQRAAIARAIVRSPNVIIADEPTGALDQSTADTVLRVLTDAALSQGAALVLATHDPLVARRADTVVELIKGRLR